MFTGIIESIGTVKGVRPLRQGRELTIDSGIDLGGDKIGDSIAVDGVCLTAAAVEGKCFTAAASGETVSRSTLGDLKPGDRVNLERALTLSSRLGGHIVQGHVDCVGTVVRKDQAGESLRVSIRYDRRFSKYLVEKGSITVDGVSLTVNGIEGDVFTVNLIPHTARSVTLTLRGPGDRVNLEFDVIGKYVERLLGREGDTSLESLLKKQGYI